MRIKVRQKDIKQAARYAVNLTNASFEECRALQKAHSFDVRMVSSGIYGINGALLQDETGTEYAIIGRTTALFMFC